MLMTKNSVAHDTVPYFMERFRDAYTTQLQNFAQNVQQRTAGADHDRGRHGGAADRRRRDARARDRPVGRGLGDQGLRSRSEETAEIAKAAEIVGLSKKTAGRAFRPAVARMTYPAICDAIRLKHVIRFVYHGGAREVEPYIYGRSTAGVELLRAYQLRASADLVKRPGGRCFRSPTFPASR